MRHEVARTLHEWRCLREEWNDLLRQSRRDCLFLTWQWLDTWLEVRDQSPELLIISVRSSTGELLGLAPYYKAHYTLRGIVPYRVLRTIGDIDCGAEYQTWISKATDDTQVFAEIAKALWVYRGEWDLIWMPKLDTWSVSSEPMIDALRACRFTVNRRPSIFSAILLPDEYDAYLESMSANRRQQIRRMSRRILSKPKVEIRRINSQQELMPALESLFYLHQKRWQVVGKDGVFVRNPKEKDFYEKFVPKALAQGWLAMYTLLNDNEPIAVQIGYVYNDVFLQLQEGFDPDYAPHAGNVLRASVIEDCIKNGLREYDFLGGISEHKRRWRAEERSGMDLLVCGPYLKNILITKVGIWPTKSYPRLRASNLGA